MKPIIYAIVIYLFFVLLVFFAFSFVRWDINPYTWGKDARGGYVVLCGLCMFFIPLITHTLNDK